MDRRAFLGSIAALAAVAAIKPADLMAPIVELPGAPIAPERLFYYSEIDFSKWSKIVWGRAPEWYVQRG